ncbi:hypothetical protein [Curtobacterium sp. MCSS17_016]|uniref:hypothetical protein n=1 Tax=Curtobacterium sp. MCSS17_016 TaxID=2175644 RepID=UPI000DA8342D|nr:hypothetical protein [Curtobacterium sp. MCSS17_016]WIE81295.1 hypothetical protein DEJ19_018855 [Curtobacterium sp. MCSS17_016]
MRRFLHADRAATDPILVIGAITVSLVLMTAGTFTLRGLQLRAADTAAKANLSSVALAEAATLNLTGVYTNAVASLTLDGKQTLAVDPGTALVAGNGCFAGFSPTPAGKWFYVTSKAGEPAPVGAPWPTTAPSGFPSGCTWPTAAPPAS